MNVKLKKVLIWLACTFVFGVIYAGLLAFGVQPGGILTAILAGITFFVGRQLTQYM